MAYLRFHVTFDVGSFAFIDILAFARVLILCISTRAVTTNAKVNIGDINPVEHIPNLLGININRIAGAFIAFIRQLLARSFVILQAIAGFTFTLHL